MLFYKYLIYKLHSSASYYLNKDKMENLHENLLLLST